MLQIRLLLTTLAAVCFAGSAAHANVLRCQLLLSDSSSQEIESSSDGLSPITNGVGELKMNYGLIDVHVIQKNETVAIQVTDKMNQVDFIKSGKKQAFAKYPVSQDHVLNVGCASADK